MIGTGSKPVTDEPVRGAIYPPWFSSLPGIERMHARGRGLVARPPVTRLFGFRAGHIGAGAVTMTMPASANFQVVPGLEIHPLLYSALWTAATTTVPAGFEVSPITISTQYFRLPRPQPGNLLARARTLNSSSVFVCTAAEIEDPEGRQVGHAVAQWAVRVVDPPPPAAPAVIQPTEEPNYPTPDPPDRTPLGAAILAERFTHQTGLEIATMLVGGELPRFPLQHLMGARWLDASEGATRFVMPASEWFCLSSKDVSEMAVQSLMGFGRFHRGADPGW